MQFLPGGVRALATGCVVLAATCAAAQSGAGVDSPDSRSAEQWLQLVQTAARKLDYAGTIVYQSGDEVRISRLVHVFDGRISHERLQPLDGRPREFIREDEEVRCLLPESKRVVVERRVRDDSFPALAGASAAELLRHYTVTVLGRERVGGMDCQVLSIKPRSNDRYGYRLWVDRASGLLLRSQTLNERGEVLEQMTFADLRIGPVDRQQLKPSWPTDGWRVEPSAHKPVDLRSHGWRVQPPAGFKSLYAVHRPMASGAALQAVFSDGLATLSVFIERASAGGDDQPLQGRGPINAFARRVGDSRITVVGEVPAGTARAVAQGAQAFGR